MTKVRLRSIPRVDVSPDGGRVVLAAATLMVHSIPHGEPILRLPYFPEGEALDVRYSQSGKLAISAQFINRVGADASVSLWNMRVCLECWRSEFRARVPRRVALSLDERIAYVLAAEKPLASCRYGVCALDGGTGEVVATASLESASPASQPTAFAVVGNAVLVAERSVVQVLDGKLKLRRRVPFPFPVPSDAPAAFAPDGRAIVVAADAHVSRLELGSGQISQRFSVPAQHVRCLAWSPSGQTLAIGIGSEISLWHGGPPTPTPLSSSG